MASSVPPMDRSYNRKNRLQTERLKQLVARLDPAQLRRPVGHQGWTVGAVLEYLAYWDGRVLAVLEAARLHDIPRAWWGDAEQAAVNHARLPSWCAEPPRQTLRGVVQVAEALDRVIEQLPPELAEAIAHERPFALDRTLHRDSHLSDIERALGIEAAGS